MVPMHHMSFFHSAPNPAIQQVCFRKKVIENSKQPNLGPLQMSLFPKHLGSAEVSLPSLSQQALSFCLLLGSPHLAPSIHSTLTYFEHVHCNISSLRRAGQEGIPPTLHSATSLKQS